MISSFVEFEEKEDKAYEGDFESQFEIGEAYLQGFHDEDFDEDFEVNINKGKLWIETAANNGYGIAQFELAKKYRYGEDWLEEDAIKSRKWLEKAANGGMSTAMYYMGEYCYLGIGEETNLEEAIRWLRRAYNDGDEYARNALIELGELNNDEGGENNGENHYREYMLTQNVDINRTNRRIQINFIDMRDREIR